MGETSLEPAVASEVGITPQVGDKPQEPQTLVIGSSASEVAAAASIRVAADKRNGGPGRLGWAGSAQGVTLDQRTLVVSDSPNCLPV